MLKWLENRVWGMLLIMYIQSQSDGLGQASLGSHGVASPAVAVHPVGHIDSFTDILARSSSDKLLQGLVIRFMPSDKNGVRVTVNYILLAVIPRGQGGASVGSAGLLLPGHSARRGKATYTDIGGGGVGGNENTTA